MHTHQNAASIVAGVLVGTAGQGMLRIHVATIVLILTAIAVLLLVTLPTLGDARAVGAFVFAGHALRWLLLAVLLITPVATIVVAIATESIQYALSTWPPSAAQTATTLELALGAAIDHGRTLVLIRIVVTIAFPIAAEGQGDAVAIVAGEVLIGAATAIAVHLIGVILAIVFAIAEPLAWYAEAILALELILGAIGACAAVRLIGVIAAIVVAIAQPILVDAAIGLGTHDMQAALLALLLQLGHHVVHVVAIDLVGAIGALHLAIAASRRLNALAIGALPLQIIADIVTSASGCGAIAIATLSQLPGIVVDHNSIGKRAETLLFIIRSTNESVASPRTGLPVRFADHIHVATPTLSAHVAKFGCITRAGGADACASSNTRLQRYHWLHGKDVTI